MSACVVCFRLVQVRHTGGETLRVATDADTAERLFSTTLHVYAHTAPGYAPSAPMVRASEAYSLPAHIARHVELVGDLRHFPTPRLLRGARSPDTKTSVTRRANKQPVTAHVCVLGGSRHSGSLAQLLEDLLAARLALALRSCLTPGHAIAQACPGVLD